MSGEGLFYRLACEISDEARKPSTELCGALQYGPEGEMPPVVCTLPKGHKGVQDASVADASRKAASSPKQTTEADVLDFIEGCCHLYRHLNGNTVMVDSRMKRLGPDQLEVHMAAGARFQILVNRLP